MSALEWPDQFYARAAVGWLELALPAEAEAELDRISLEARFHPDVLEVRWMLCAARDDWNTGLEVARELLHAAPDRVSAWLHHAYALRRSTGGGLEAAFQALRPAANVFPNEPTVPFNLACYSCQMGRPNSVTMRWLRKAATIGNRAEIIAMALHDPDLKPVRRLVEAMRSRR
jgi:Flp pilus assembly protein TadD